MQFSLLNPADFIKMPWKNGKGETTQLFISPAKASLSDFDYRISCATLSESGPFSLFTGYDRILTLLPSAAAKRTSVALVHDGKTRIEMPVGVPAAFSGDISTFCELSSPAELVDFNVIVKRAGFKAETWSCQFQPDSEWFASTVDGKRRKVTESVSRLRIAQPGQYFVFCSTGATTCLLESDGRKREVEIRAGCCLHFSADVDALNAVSFSVRAAVASHCIVARVFASKSAAELRSRL